MPSVHSKPMTKPPTLASTQKTGSDQTTPHHRKMTSMPKIATAIAGNRLPIRSPAIPPVRPPMSPPISEDRDDDGGPGRGRKAILVHDIGRDVEGHCVESVSERDEDQEADQHAAAEGAVTQGLDHADAPAVGAPELGKHGAETRRFLQAEA